MKKKEMKTCVKCGEKYFGEECVGCHSNQYSRYTKDTPIKMKVFIAVVFLVIIGVVIAIQ